jgi:uncharacterized OB-fold protein
VQPEWKDAVCYVVAFIALDEAPRLLSNIVDCDPESAAIGQRVTCVFVATAEPDLSLPVFRLS